MTTQSQYRIQFVRLDTTHWPSGSSFTGPLTHNRYFRTKRSVLYRLLRLFYDPLVRAIEITERRAGAIQGFYSAFPQMRFSSKTTVQGKHLWHPVVWLPNSWKVLSTLLDTEERYWDRFREEAHD